MGTLSSGTGWIIAITWHSFVFSGYCQIALPISNRQQQAAKTREETPTKDLTNRLMTQNGTSELTKVAGAYRVQCVRGIRCDILVPWPAGYGSTYVSYLYDPYATPEECRYLQFSDGSKIDRPLPTREELANRDIFFLPNGIRKTCNRQISLGVIPAQFPRNVLPMFRQQIPTVLRVTITSRKMGVQIAIDNPIDSDSGRYYVYVSSAGVDPVQTLELSIVPPPRAEPSIEDVFETEVEDEVSTYIIQEEEFGVKTPLDDHHRQKVHRAVANCQGNFACAKDVLALAASGLEGPCFVCSGAGGLLPSVAMRPKDWKTITTFDTNNTTNLTKMMCQGPSLMCWLLAFGIEGAARDLVMPKVKDIDPRQTMYPSIKDPIPVKPVNADLCIKRAAKPNSLTLGNSACKRSVEIFEEVGTHGATVDCIFQRTEGGSDESVGCPELTLLLKDNWISPALVWICNDRGYHTLPQNWSGTCYPAILKSEHIFYPMFKNAHKQYVFPPIVATSQMTPLPTPARPATPAPRIKRSAPESSPALGMTDTSMDRDKLTKTYPGYWFSNPWASELETAGESILPFIGVGWNSARINTLAADTLLLRTVTLQTNSVLMTLTHDVDKIRALAIQNKIALDHVTSQAGGSCKYIQALDGSYKCCTAIASHLNESVNVLKRSRELLQGIDLPGHPLDPLGWLSGLGTNWTSWLMSIVFPIVVCFFAILLVIYCLPALVKCFARRMSRMSPARQDSMRETLLVFEPLTKPRELADPRKGSLWEATKYSDL